jgi:hypothetical protein
MMRTLPSLLVVGLGVLLLGPSIASACSCAPPPAPTLALEASAVVFEGTAVTVPEPPGEGVQQGFGAVEYRFNVARSWKGDPGMEVRLTTNRSGAACGRQFTKGETYIVYASAGDDGLRDSACSRTRAVSSAADDLEALGEGVVPHARGGARPVPPSGDGATSAPAAPTEGTPGTDVDAEAAAEAPVDGGAEPAAASEPMASTDGGAAAPAADASPEDDEPLRKGPRENCSVSSSDVGNTAGLVLLTLCIVALRRRIGV